MGFHAPPDRNGKGSNLPLKTRIVFYLIVNRGEKMIGKYNHPRARVQITS